MVRRAPKVGPEASQHTTSCTNCHSSRKHRAERSQPVKPSQANPSTTSWHKWHSRYNWHRQCRCNWHSKCLTSTSDDQPTRVWSNLGTGASHTITGASSTGASIAHSNCIAPACQHSSQSWWTKHAGDTVDTWPRTKSNTICCGPQAMQWPSHAASRQQLPATRMLTTFVSGSGWQCCPSCCAGWRCVAQWASKAPNEDSRPQAWTSRAGICTNCASRPTTRTAASPAGNAA